MLDVAPDTISVTDNIFTDFVLTPIDATLLRRKLTEQGIEVDGTAIILHNGTVPRLRTTFFSPTGAKLSRQQKS